VVDTQPSDLDMRRRQRFAPDNLAVISVNGAECNKCRHVSDDGLYCKAFPDGIPMEILSGKVQHRTSHPGDNGIRFEPWP